MSQIFHTPQAIVTGAGCFRSLGEHARPLGRKCLLVSGKASMQDQGFVDMAVAMLGEVGITTTVCLGVEHDPSLATVDDAREIFRQKECDLVLGLGGGSALDVAKAVAGLAASEEPASVFFGGAEIPESQVPVIAAPSTFGTGSEVTRVSVLSDPAKRVKKSIRHDCMLPKVALVDPLLGMGASRAVAAACGMDAMTQAIESYLSRHAFDLTESLSFHATVLLHDGLPRIYEDPSDVEARENCANGSLMAGMALNNARLGVVHGLAHPLGARTGAAHGELCGILLPYALRYNREACSQKYELLSGVLGGDAAECCEALLRKMELPLGLKHLSVQEDDFGGILEEALASGSTAANPRTVGRDDLETLLREACIR